MKLQHCSSAKESATCNIQTILVAWNHMPRMGPPASAEISHVACM